MKRFVYLFVFGLILTTQSMAASPAVKGFNLTEATGMKYDANPSVSNSQHKTLAQIAVDEMAKLGANHVILNPRATMDSPFSNIIKPMTPPAQLRDEQKAYERLINYIHSKGMTVGIRPILFVVNPDGSTPYKEVGSDGKIKIWWHGNIQPRDPNAWFESFRQYLDLYIKIAQKTNAAEFTIGAELYSMTVGIEDQWLEYPYGFPAQWNSLLQYTRGKLPNARLMYDINFTDDSVTSGGLGHTGGEIERWRYRLVELGPPTDPVKRRAWENDPNGKPIWELLAQFWLDLDAVGIDMYRSLGRRGDSYPSDIEQLTQKLQAQSDQYAIQLDFVLGDIEDKLGFAKKVIFKEVGYKSSELGFIDPFAYEGGSVVVNLSHQAAAYAAFLNSFWFANWSWFEGVAFWDISINPSKKGPQDPGFSPVGKAQTESIIKSAYEGDRHVPARW